MLRVFSNKIIIYMSPTRMISDCVFSAIRTMWEHSSCWAHIESISAVRQSPYHFLAHPTLPAVPTFMRHLRHSRDVSDVRLLSQPSDFIALRSHLVQPIPNPSYHVNSLTSALISISFHIPMHFALMACLMAYYFTITFNPNSSHHLPHVFGLCS